MTYKISILTPVHISSGNKNACFLYHPDKNDHFNCYRIEDLLQFIPPQKLLELQPDNASNNGKKDIIKLFNNYVNYNQLKPQYFLFYKFKPFSKDVTEQVKSLNKPYIPGSSIKGAIMNAIIFNLLNDNKEKIKEFLINFNRNLSKNFEKELLSYLFGKDFEEIFKLFSSCICCEDIFFDTMILCDSDRLNMKNNNRNQSQEFNKFECIDNLQEKNTNLFMIDQTRQKVFLNKYSNKEIIKKLRIFFNKRNIIIACRNYFRTIIKDDKKYFIEDQFDYFKESDFEGRDQIINFLNTISFDNKDICYLRIGNSTNYFYKSISIFIKKNFYEFYDNNFSLFAPIRLGKKNSPKADTMPKTRIIFKYDSECYLPGFIKVEPYEEN